MKYLVNNGHRAKIGLIHNETFVEKIGFNFSFKTMVMDNQKNTLVRYSCIHVILFSYTSHILKMPLVNINPVYKYKCMYITLLNLIYGLHVNYIPYDSFLLILTNFLPLYAKAVGGGEVPSRLERHGGKGGGGGFLLGGLKN